MRKLISVLVLLAACRSAQPAPATRPTPSGSQTGAPSARAAVQEFLASVRAEDLQAMSTVWGTTSGPARDALPRQELEKRELIMMCYFRHDSSRILEEAPGTGGKTVFAVELKRGGLTGSTNFYVVAGPRGRWYVESADLNPLRRFCSRS